MSGSNSDVPYVTNTAPDDRLFNEHIDKCLSRDAIRDVVKESSLSNIQEAVTSPQPKRLKTMTENDGKEEACRDYQLPFSPLQTETTVKFGVLGSRAEEGLMSS